MDEEYCLYAEKRLEMAEKDTSIQGYSGGVFWERNTLKDMKNRNAQKLSRVDQLALLLDSGGDEK